MKVCEHKWEPVDGLMCHLCKYEKCTVCGSIRRTIGCENHSFRMAHYNHPSYYSGAFDNGIQRADLHIKQLKEAMGEAKYEDYLPGIDTSLEIGAGTGFYIPFFSQVLIRCDSVEPSEYGATFIRQVYDAKVYQETFEEYYDKHFRPQSYDMVFSAHWLEHMRDADVQFARMAEIARHSIICLVPVGTDTANRDHWWYFTADVLKKWSEACGFDATVVRKAYTPHEDFLFLFATRRDKK